MNDATGMPQTAVVVGGTSDIARAVLRALVARRLRRVVLAGRDEIGLAAAAEELQALGATVGRHRPSATSPTDRLPAALAEDAAARLGQVDLVLVAAGMLGDQADRRGRPRSAARVLDTNFTGRPPPWLAFAAVLRAQGHGRIVVLSSVAGVRVRRANFVYGASKAGLDAFAVGLAEALRGTGASLMIVRPGWVATAHDRRARPRLPSPPPPTPWRPTSWPASERSAAVVWSPAPLRLRLRRHAARCPARCGADCRADRHRDRTPAGVRAPPAGARC